MNPQKKHKQYYYNRMQLTANLRSYVRNPGIRCQVNSVKQCSQGGHEAVPVTTIALNIRVVNCCTPNTSRKYWVEDAGPVRCDTVSLS
jgi:aspartyl aminopeptidase